MKFHLRRITFFIFALFAFNGFAQDLALNNISWSSQLYNLGDNGFYLYYLTPEDQEDAEMSHRIRFMDKTFTTTGEAVVPLQKYAYYGPSVSNGSAVISSYVNPKAKSISVISFDAAGNQLGKMDFYDSKIVLPSMHKSMPLIEIEPVEDGFVIMTAIRKNRLRADFRLTKVDNNMKTIWTREYLAEGQTLFVNSILGQGSATIVSYGQGPLSAYKQAETEQIIVKLDHAGNELFRYTVEEKDYFMPMHLELSGEDLLIAGSIAEFGKPLGFSVLRINSAGEKINSGSVYWTDIVEKVPVTDSRMKHLKQAPKFMFHDVVLHKDENISVVAESVYSEPSIILHGSNRSDESAVAFWLSDFFIFNLDTDLTLLHFGVVEKRERSVTVAGVDMFDAWQPQMQKKILLNGGTNFQFVKENSGKNYLVYTDYQKTDEAEGQYCKLADLSAADDGILAPEFSKFYNKNDNIFIYTLANAADKSIHAYLLKTSGEKREKEVFFSLSTLDVF